MLATANVPTVEHQILAESLRHVVSICPDVAMVIAKQLEDKHETRSSEEKR